MFTERYPSTTYQGPELDYPVQIEESLELPRVEEVAPIAGNLIMLSVNPEILAAGVGMTEAELVTLQTAIATVKYADQKKAAELS